MANRSGKEIDSHYLSFNYDNVREMIHRDYLAHCLRYNHIAKFLIEKKRHFTHHVLDVGCGRETSLMRLLYASRKSHTTGSYTGVDIGPINRAPDTTNWKSFNYKLFPQTDFATWKPARKSYDVIVGFEMLEHIEPYHAFQVLKKMHATVKADGDVFVSTPCYNPRIGPAAVHVNEMSYKGLRALLQLAGFRIVGNWGTFANQRDYKHLLDTRVDDVNKAKPTQVILSPVFEVLSKYYFADIVACLFAPLFPEQARNCLWHLKRGGVAGIEAHEYDVVRKPEHGSSKRWSTDLRKIVKEVARVAV